MLLFFYSLVVFLPLFAGLILSVFGFRLGVKGTSLFTFLCLANTALLSFYSFISFGFLEIPMYLPLYNWISSGSFNVEWSLQIDNLSLIMFILITFVSTCVYVYSISYMLHDPHFIRFSVYICYFVFAMLILVSSNNWVQLFFGWELVGILSFLLISFWYTILQANKSAIQAVLFNKIGDISLLLGISVSFGVFRSVDFDTVFSLTLYDVNSYIYLYAWLLQSTSILGFFLILAAVGKSAQLGLHLWLPSAMTRPTPVSALIHAATMVTAGVFLVIRCSIIFEQVDVLLVIMTGLGAITAFFAATVGLVQNDLKKTIAYSTASQLRYMFLACGLSHYSVALFHLYTHGFFKALLFLCAGSVIHSMSDEQSFARMGGLMYLMPVTYICMLVGSLALMRFPFLSRFYSKDRLLEVAAGTYSVSGTFSYWLGLRAAVCTAFYSFRLLFFTFWSLNNSYKPFIVRTHESGIFILIPLSLLCIRALFVGYLFQDLIVRAGSTFLRNSLYIAPKHLRLLDAEFLPIFIKSFPLLFSSAGAICSILLYNYFFYETFLFQRSFVGSRIYSFLNQKWYFDLLLNRMIVKPGLNIGYTLSFRLLDKGWFEFFGPLGLVLIVNYLSKILARTASGLIQHSILFMIVGVLLLLILVTLFPIIEFVSLTPLYILLLCLIPLVLTLQLS